MSVQMFRRSLLKNPNVTYIRLASNLDSENAHGNKYKQLKISIISARATYTY